MKPILYEKKLDMGALLKKQMSSREVANIVGLSQSKVNRIKKKPFENILMLSGGRPQALTTWKKKYVVRLATIGGLDSTVEITRELKSATKVDMCVERVKNALREASLGLAEKVSKLASSTKNVKKRLEFAKMHKDWTVRHWVTVVFSNDTKINLLCFDGINWCWICDKKNLPANSVK
jgi:transposase